MDQRSNKKLFAINQAMNRRNYTIILTTKDQEKLIIKLKHLVKDMAFDLVASDSLQFLYFFMGSEKVGTVEYYNLLRNHVPT